MMCFALHIPATDTWYCCERFIPGEYVKFNSNQGYVDRTPAGWCRSTPQAFSHFTFEISQGRSMVCDVQGVDDLYTDPEIQSLVGTDYGEGNLGPKGMALFFRTHRCNAICAALGLHPVTMHPSELAEAAAAASNEGGVPGHGLEGTLVRMTHQPSPVKRMRAGGLRGSLSSAALSLSGADVPVPAALAALRKKARALPEPEAQNLLGLIEQIAAKLGVESSSGGREGDHGDGAGGSGNVAEAEDSRARITGTMSSRGGLRDALALVHVELAKLNALREPEPNNGAAMFHYVQAALHGHTSTALGLANLYADHPSTLVSVTAPVDLQRARFFAEIAAGNGSRCATLKMATLVEDAASRVNWLERALTVEPLPLIDEESHEADTANYEIWAEIAQSVADPDRQREAWNAAAEEAMAQGKGKLAAKYFANCE
jgi:hypothetical protein